MGEVEEMMCIVWECVTKGDSGYGCELASNLSKYDSIKDDFFVLSWTRVR